MGQENQTTVKLNKEDKPVVKEAQDELEKELGVRPTQGEAVILACKRLVEGSA